MLTETENGLRAARQALINLDFCDADPEVVAIDGALGAIAAERERCAVICEEMRGSIGKIVAPLTNAAYDEACRDCAAAIREQPEAANDHKM